MSDNFMEKEGYDETLSNMIVSSNYNDIGKWIFYILDNKFKCYNPEHSKRGLWYYKDENSEWKHDKYCTKLLYAIMEDVNHALLYHIHDYTTKMQTMEQTDQTHEAMRKGIIKMAKISVHFRETKKALSLIEEIKYIFYDEKFKPNINEMVI
jgi:hypothetical protein